MNLYRKFLTIYYIMNPLTILIIIVIIVLVFMFIRYLIVDPYTLQSIQNGKDASTILVSVSIEIPFMSNEVIYFS